MLTRLKVSGFKNLVDVDVRLGPFTCIAGANGVGKSNLFDAIQFLSFLADRPLIEAALAVRGGETAGVKSLFHRVGSRRDDVISLTAEMIVPSVGVDDLGKEAKATSTFLKYTLEVACRNEDPTALEILKEELDYVTQGDAHKHILFDHSAARWRRSVVKNSRRTESPFISTTGGGADGKIRIHQDGEGKRAVVYRASRLPRTVLSSARADDSPTALLARREMQSWRLLQLEPSSLRKPDPFAAPTRLGTDGSHLAATLYRLARRHRDGADSETLYARVANRLAELFEDVKDLWVDRDEKRELLTVHVQTHDGTVHPAPALSDGSLRFLALAVLDQATDDQGLICLEEPENGVHPERLPAMLRLLRDLTTDVQEEVGPDNPMRQVIVNTHSPAVVQQVPEDSLLVAVPRVVVRDKIRSRSVAFKALPNTWRQDAPDAPKPVSLGTLLSYLNPVIREDLRLQFESPAVVERGDVRELLPLSP